MCAGITYDPVGRLMYTAFSSIDKGMEVAFVTIFDKSCMRARVTARTEVVWWRVEKHDTLLPFVSLSTCKIPDD